jgi:hypothetical protein
LAEFATLDRPLEFRFSDASVASYFLSAAVDLGKRWQWTASLNYLDERRDRPDPSGFRFDQLRLATQLRVSIGDGADHLWLPPARKKADR